MVEMADTNNQQKRNTYNAIIFTDTDLESAVVVDESNLQDKL